MSAHPDSPDGQANSANSASNPFDGEPRSLLTHLLEAVLEQVSEPKNDLEQNVKSALSNVFKRYDLVTREEFEQQQQNLVKAQALLKDLKRQLDEITAA
jgi:BMFP domain-containing protein YqiC